VIDAYFQVPGLRAPDSHFSQYPKVVAFLEESPFDVFALHSFEGEKRNSYVCLQTARIDQPCPLCEIDLDQSSNIHAPRPYLSALNPRNFESFERLYTDLVKVTKPLQIVSSLMPKFLGVIRENLDKIPTFRPVQIKSRTEIVIRGADSNPKLIARLRTLQPSKFDPVESSYFFRCFPKPSSVNRLLGPFGSVHSIEFDEDRELLTLYATSEYFLDSQAQDIQAVPYEEIRIRVNLESLPAGAEHPFEVDGLHDLPWWWTKFEVYSDSLLKGASPWRT